MNLPFRAAAFVHRFLIAGLVLAGLSVSAIPAYAVTVEEIPTPRPSGWTVDLTGTLPPGTVAELNRLGNEVKAKTGAELAVVVVGSTGGVEPRELATRLFNHWGIGERDKDNGLLVFAALDDRAAEIILGDGLNDAVRAQAREEIMQGVMVPRFREGDPAGAVLQGATACASRILGVSPAVGAGPRAPKKSPVSAEAPALSKLVKARPLPEASPVPFRRSPAPLAQLGVGFFLLLLAFSSVVAGVIWLALRPQRCPRCRTKMVLLSEVEDDAHLQPSERMEEKIGSVNHKVWLCPSCGEVKKTQRWSFLSSYTSCPSCSARTVQSTSRTVQAATYDSGGLVQVEGSCAYCSHKTSYTYATPRLERPAPTYYEEDRSHSSSSSSLFSSSSSSSSSSSPSSSSGSGFGGGQASSSDSSFGGGHSSGDGSSGRW